VKARRKQLQAALAERAGRDTGSNPRDAQYLIVSNIFHGVLHSYLLVLCFPLMIDIILDMYRTIRPTFQSVGLAYSLVIFSLNITSSCVRLFSFFS
jgi:hypothetical protein